MSTSEKLTKNALISGASRGIGRAIAINLSRAGYRCALVARDKKGLQETAAACNEVQQNSCTLILPFDLSQASAPREIIEALSREWGNLDVLINNAGCTLSKSVDDSLMEEWDELMNLNARAPFFLAQRALPLLRKSSQAAIVNIGSVVCVKGYPMQAIYSATKHALAGWTKSLAGEVAAEGIRVHLVMPGGVATDMVRQVRPDIDTDDLIRPEEVADAVEFLLAHRGNSVIDVLDLHRVGKMPFG